MDVLDCSLPIHITQPVIAADTACLVLLVSLLFLSVSASTAADDTVEVRRTVVMASDAPAPGYPDGWTISASPGTPIRVGPMNASGEFFVSSGVAPPGWSTALRDVGWRRGTQDALEIIFESDLPLAGLSPSDTFKRLEFGSITSDGEAQFNARESGSKSVILRHTPLDGFRILARRGEQAPGTPAGTTFSQFSGPPRPSRSTRASSCRRQAIRRSKRDSPEAASAKATTSGCGSHRARPRSTSWREKATSPPARLPSPVS